jgi:hypothetical protein
MDSSAGKKAPGEKNIDYKNHTLNFQHPNSIILFYSLHILINYSSQLPMPKM